MFKLSGTQPGWISDDADLTIITDQLLHAYYYTYVLKGSDESRSINAVNSQYSQNIARQEQAIDQAIEWWQTLDRAPLNEDVHINKWGPLNRDTLAQVRSRDLTEDELLTVLLQNHAARNHARQIRNSFFGLPDGYQVDIEERTRIYGRWLYGEKTDSGLSISQVLRFLLFQDDMKVEERVYEGINNPKYHLEHFGKSIVGEIVGWGRPDITHLRNNRVNKALRCLGFDVRLFSEA